MKKYCVSYLGSVKDKKNSGTVTEVEVEPTSASAPWLSRILSKETLEGNENIFDELQKRYVGNAVALFNLALCYDFGLGNEQKEDMAKASYQMAYIQASLNNGEKRFLPGDKDTFRIVAFPSGPDVFMDGAKMNAPVANYLVGMAYLSGDGVKRDAIIANGFFLASAEAGFFPAMTELGISRLEGRGGPIDEEGAESFFLKASLFGNLDAKYYLAKMNYQKGNKEEALAAFRSLAASGHELAKESLKELGLE